MSKLNIEFLVLKPLTCLNNTDNGKFKNNVTGMATRPRIITCKYDGYHLLSAQMKALQIFLKAMCS